MRLSEAVPDDVIRIDREIKHDEVVSFVKKMGYDKAPLILNVEGKKVAMNFVSTRERLCKYLGIERDQLAKYLSSLNYIDFEVEDFESTDMKKKLDLKDLPIIKYFPKDGGKYITAGVVIAPFNGKCNACIHRLMVKDNRLVARLVKPRHTYLLWEKAIREGRELEVAIAIGVHPLVLFASATRVPEGEEFRYANALLRGKLKLYKYGKLLIPPAEIVILGRITAEMEREGPFVDITGTYDVVREQPVVEIDEILSVSDPIYYSITPASSEHQVLMGIPYEPVIYESVSRVCKVKNVVMSKGGMHYFHAIVQIEKHSEGDGKNAILAAFSAHHSLKHVVVVDEDVDIFNPEDVEYAIATRFQADKDLVMVKGARGSSLDPSSKDGITTKLGIDATMDITRREAFERVG